MMDKQELEKKLAEIRAEMYENRLNPDALIDLYEACLSALGAYKALKMFGDDKYLPGYEHCLRDLEAAIAKAKAGAR